MQSRGQRGSLTTNSIRELPRAICGRWMGLQCLWGRGWRQAPEAPNSFGTNHNHQKRGLLAQMVNGMPQTCGAQRGGSWQGPAMAGGLLGRSPSTADGILRWESRRETRGESGWMERRCSSGWITWGQRQCPLKTHVAAARSSHPPLAALADPPSRSGRRAAGYPSDPPWGRAQLALRRGLTWSPGGAPGRSGSVLGRRCSAQRRRAAPGPGRTFPR